MTDVTRSPRDGGGQAESLSNDQPQWPDHPAERMLTSANWLKGVLQSKTVQFFHEDCAWADGRFDYQQDELPW